MKLEDTHDSDAAGEAAGAPLPAQEVAVSDRSSQDPRPPDPLLGQLIAERYRITHLIGSGGMGAVYRAEHIHMKKPVALKVLHREMTAVPEVVLRFEREAIAAGRIEHPNIAQARDFGRLPDGAFYLVLEYVEGRTLSAVLENEGRFSVERTLSVVGQIAEALQAAAEQQIVHRDLKPDNVMLVSSGDGIDLVKVLDFGIAKVDIAGRAGSEKPITRVGTVFGTPEYMSPEQASGQSVDPRSDLYALGLLMYRMLSGRPAFVADEVSAILMMQITQPAPPLPEPVPEGVAQLLNDLLEKDAKHRVQTAALVVQRVLSLLGSGSLAATSRTRTKLASTALADSRPRLVERLDASVVGRRVPLGVGRFPLWRVLVVAVSGATLAWLGVWLIPKRVSSPPVVGEVPAQVSGGSDPALEKWISKAFGGDEEAIAELERHPESQRSVRQWLALGRGRAKLKQGESALAAYRAALELEPSVSEDPILRREIWAAAKEPPTAELALKLAAKYLGATGADLLYKVWVETKEVTPATTLAKTLVYSPEVRAAASPALALLLDWREAEGCDKLGSLLERASISGDYRATVLLARMSKAP
ncbi:MAG: hypothetical protein RJA70_4806, partial [Pseudomonadota bacterium]